MKVKITQKENTVSITNNDCFYAVSDFTISNGLDIVENVIISTENKTQDNSITQIVSSLDYSKNTYGDICIFTFFDSDVIVEDFDKLKVLNSPKGFVNASINLGHVIYIDKKLHTKDLIKLYKLITTTKTKTLSNMALPIHIQNILNKNDFLAVLCNTGDVCDFDEVKLKVQDAVEISIEDAFSRITCGILDYLVSEGILIGDLIEAGVEIIGDVGDDFKNNLEREILNSLSDINIIILLLAAIRLKNDLINNRIREINTSDKLYSCGLFGFLISNQIAGTCGVIKFNQYLETKPGIIYGLPICLDSAFAGLIGGCVAKTLNG